MTILIDGSGHGHIHDEQGNHIGDICIPSPNCYYVARIHRRGAHKYEVVSRHRSEVAAVKAMAVAFATDRKSWNPVNRADVLRVEKGMSYYDPIQICELKS